VLNRFKLALASLAGI
jgi:hypothetical protein